MPFHYKMSFLISKLKKNTPFSLKKIIIVSSRDISLIIKKIKRSFISPTIPQNPDGKILIHLGCGEKNAPGWINVDLLKLPHIHFLQDATNLSNFKTNFADLIYASHVLEHVPHQQTISVLKEWRRVLKPSGVLRLSVPDFDKIIHIYNSENKNIESIIKPLMGGQDYQYNFHQNVFNQNYLSFLLKQAGFSQVKSWYPQNAPYHTFSDWSSKLISVNNKKYPISLNLEAVK